MKIFDAHFHIIDPKFPLIENQGYLPDPFTHEQYLKRTKGIQLEGGAIVSGSFQGYDQTYLLHALKQLGENFVGVTQLPYEVSDADIMKLHDGGVRALRFNVKRGGSEDIARLDAFARRVYNLAGWHTELYIDAISLPEIALILERLPAVSIDHLGLSKEGLPHLLALVNKGVKVKATGFGRVDFDVEEALRTIYEANPHALMFGTDLPSTRAKRPYCDDDINLVYRALPLEAAEKVLYKNARAWYLQSR
ncbi:amidohydrolase family protein [Bacillus sp. FSL W7-1360]